MKSKRLKIGLIFVLVFLIISSFLIYLLGRENIGLAIDRIGVTKNKFHITIDEKINTKDLYIYWIGETEYTRNTEYNQMLIHHVVLQCDVSPSYGKNKFIIKYQDKTSENWYFKKTRLFKT
ncbi:MAG: hypothetical protein LBQ60_06740 [Bacteroidales bacterium]|jgi:hypothetical protein|nr:hypothetical protein [Bacteroidales bacterium]